MVVLPVMRAVSTSGAIPSTMPTVVELRPLPAGESRTEPGPWSYDSDTASGRVSRSSPSSSRTRTRGSAGSDLDCETDRPPTPVSSPDTDQPPTPDAETASSNSTRMVSLETAVALSTPGACPSASVRFCWPTSTLPGSTTNQPVAFGAASAPSNSTTCSAVPPPR